MPRLALTAISMVVAYAIARTSANSIPSSEPAAAMAVSTRPLQVYTSDFASGKVDLRWSTARTTKCPSGTRTFLGTFGAESVTLSLDDLPSHARIRLSFDFLSILTWDGDAYLEKPTDVGPDVFNVTVNGGPRLIHASFICGPAFPAYTQSFPGSFPYDHVPGGTGAAQAGSLGYSYSGKDVPGPDDYVYRIQRTFGHTGKSLKISFSGLNVQEKADECWGLDNVKVEILPPAAPPTVNAQTLEQWGRALGNEDPASATEIIAALVESGLPALQEIRRQPEPPPTDDDRTIQKLIAQLNDESYQTRESASAALKELGAAASPAMHEALTHKSLAEETRARIESILSASKNKSWEPPAQRRARRVVETLELIGTDESRTMLADIAAHATSSASYEAVAALKRLQGQSPIPSKLDLPPRHPAMSR